MPGRFEIKYLLDSDDAQRTLDAASGQMKLDSHAGPDGRYRVHSLYYDTVDFESFREVEDGQIAKTKFRFRRYGSSGPGFFEVKSRYNRTIRKTREPASREAADAYVAEPFDRPLPGDCAAFSHRLASRPRKPVVSLCYDRIALEGLIDTDFRLTLDFDLRCGSPERFGREPDANAPRGLPPGIAVLELKFSSKIPRWVSRLTRTLDAVPRDCSKYVRSVRRWISGQAPITELSRYG
jgi:hypothetical protein